MFLLLFSASLLSELSPWLTRGLVYTPIGICSGASKKFSSETNLIPKEPASNAKGYLQRFYNEAQENWKAEAILNDSCLHRDEALGYNIIVALQATSHADRLGMDTHT